ncbi:polyphosphate kinase 2 [uncultured Hyphomonas sp.]|uniref:polyphosphate kinase 2 n=1 Tax=uncultured Hyphomonas sp. TaxID=225298 RepID=UPI0030D708FE
MHMPKNDRAETGISKKDYKRRLRALQVELVKIQRRTIKHGHRILVIFEGRDAAGKDGVIKRIADHLSPRDTRIVALGKPSDRETRSWYFQRYAEHLPADGEIALFNRSWYNRAGVEKVMGFASDNQVGAFFDTVSAFEKMLVRDGTQILKYYLDISRTEQEGRLADRDDDPLKQWKKSPIDAAALEKWDDYSTARDEMLRRTDFEFAPWYAVHTDDKRTARLNILSHMITAIECPDTDTSVAAIDPAVIISSPGQNLMALAD